MSDPSPAAVRLTQLQDLTGIKRRELARLASLDESAVRHFQSGAHRTMTADALSRLASVFGVRTDYLLHGSPEPKPERVRAAVARARKPARRTTAAA